MTQTRKATGPFCALLCPVATAPCSVRLPASAPFVRTGIQLQNKGKHHRGNPVASSLTLTWHSYTHPVHRQRLSLLAAAPPLNDTVPGGRLHAQRSQSPRRNFCLPCALTEMPRHRPRRRERTPGSCWEALQWETTETSQRLRRSRAGRYSLMLLAKRPTIEPIAEASGSRKGGSPDRDREESS